MEFLRGVFGGMSGVLSVNPSPLYRYPYRNSAEGLSGDIGRVGKDIAYTLDDEDGR